LGTISNKSLSAYSPTRDRVALIKGHFRDAVVVHLFEEGGIVDGLRRRTPAAEIAHRREYHDGDDRPEQYVFCEIVQCRLLYTSELRTVAGKFKKARHLNESWDDTTPSQTGAPTGTAPHFCYAKPWVFAP